MKDSNTPEWLHALANSLFLICVISTLLPISASAFNERLLISDLYLYDKQTIEESSNEKLLSYQEKLSEWVKNIMADPVLSKEDKLHWLGRIQEKLTLMKDISFEKADRCRTEIHRLELEKESQRMKTQAMIREIERRGR